MDTEKAQLKEEYHGYVFKKIIFIIFCCLVVLIVAGIAATLGGRDIGFFEVYELIYNHLCGVSYPSGSVEWWDDYAVWNIRLPRIIMAVIAGVALAVGGVAMQSVMNNPLADPYTTGISSGACFGAIAALVMGLTISSVLGQYGIVTNAFLCGLVPALIIIFISRYSNGSPATMILAGTAISYVFNALNTLVLVSSDADDISAAYLWQIGSLDGASWGDLPLMFVITLMGSVFIGLSARKLNVLTLGDNSAKSLGLDAANFRMILLILLSVMTAAIVCYTGIIGFVGLVAPHIVRMVIGADNRYLIPASMAFGAALLLSADVIARVIVSPSSLPVGVIMAFLGGPLFLYLILKKKKEVW
ncbi:FecCD family ABC transporter permease [Candidatus Methanomassiliicoccus intestinalis]|uniref:FecCD family ABC transporter permease n=1 Tax=Candidatus Methanomassiliicoccus intestinalis TaxID=1406512 RepID=UPI0037DD87E0